MGTSARRPPRLMRWVLLAAAAAVVIAGTALLLHESASGEPSAAGPPRGEEAATAPSLPPPMPEPQPSAPVALLAEADDRTEPGADAVFERTDRQAARGTTRTVEAIVVAADGTPVVGASIEAYVTEEFDPSDLINRLSKSEKPSVEDVQRLMDLDSETEDAAWLDPVGRWTSGVEGSAHVDIPSSEMLLVASHPDLGTSGAVLVKAGLGGGDPSWVRLELSPRGTVHGRVLDSAGAPVPGAHVVFKRAHMPDERARPRLPRPLDADAEGRFSVEVDTPYFGIVQARLDDGRQTVKEYVHARPGSPGEVELRFPGGFAVTGVVLDSEGRPHPSARIDVAGFEVQADAVGTRSDGSFRLTLSKPGHVVLVAKAEGLITADAVAATVSQEAPVADVVIRMIEPATISGRVEWTDGTPIGDVTVFAHMSMPDFESKTAEDTLERFASLSRDEMALRFELGDQAESSDDGRFRLGSIHPAFNYDLTCYGGGRRAGSVKVKDVRPGSTDVVIAYEKQGGSRSLRGTVIDAETRAPVPRSTVRCSEWRFGHAMPFALDDVEIDETTGRFWANELQPGLEYGLVVEAIGYPETSFGPFKPSDDQLELVLGRHGGLRIDVVDESGAPRRGARVQLMSGEERGFGAIFTQVEEREAGTDGRVEWARLQPGSYSVEAVSNGLRAPRQVAVVEAGDVSPVHLVVRAPSGTGSVEVQVLSKDGSPRAGAQVKLVLYVEDEGHRPGLEPVFLGRTDADGRYMQPGLDPGSYIVDVESDGMQIPLRKVGIVADALTRIAVTSGE